VVDFRQEVSRSGTVMEMNESASSMNSEPRGGGRGNSWNSLEQTILKVWSLDQCMRTC
jgi:hypothetical protein